MVALQTCRREAKRRTDRQVGLEVEGISDGDRAIAGGSDSKGRKGTLSVIKYYCRKSLGVITDAHSRSLTRV